MRKFNCDSLSTRCIKYLIGFASPTSILDGVRAGIVKSGRFMEINIAQPAAACPFPHGHLGILTDPYFLRPGRAASAGMVSIVCSSAT